MEDRSRDKLTFARYFLEPSNPTHRRYEALRAYFIDGLPPARVAARFGYTPGSFRVLVHQFRHDPERPFFVHPIRQIKLRSRQKRLRDRIVALRKQNASIYEISRTLSREDEPISSATVAGILKEGGFARLPRRFDEERPQDVGPTTADIADVRRLGLAPRQFRTKFGGLFLFVPALVAAELDAVLRRARLPGSEMIPAGCAVRSLLGLKLFGNARHSHVMGYVLDGGLALFAGLNVVPKRSFLTEYSGRIDPACSPKLIRDWFDVVSRLGLQWGTSFDLDFHTIPFDGEDPLVEKRYVSKRSRRQKGVSALLARDADRRVFCYADADLREDQRSDEVLQFVSFWERRTGRPPAELVFDSRLTTHANLSRLNRKGIRSITLRRRSAELLRALAAQPAPAWRRIELEGVSRAYRTPRVLDQRVTLPGYEGPLRRLAVTDLGHEEPTLLITNQLGRSATPLISRYSRPMVIENGIEDGIDFFHMDALSPAVALEVNCDLQLTLMASSLYRLLGGRIGHGYETAKSRHLFRDFIDATATVALRETDVVVRFQKRAHNPLLLAAGFDKTQVNVPWLGNKPLRFVFGWPGVAFSPQPTTRTRLRRDTTRGTAMSEYQCYESRAIDRSLTRKEMDELRSLSTRAEITPTSFTNTYHWGDFKGNPAALMDRYFDAFVYVAEWGTHRLMFRIPRRFLDAEAASAYCDGEVLSLKAKEEHVVLEFSSEDGSGDEWTEGEHWMPSLISLRAELMRGAFRALCLGWLASLRSHGPDDGDGWDEEDADDDQLEPPIPPGLAQLSAPPRASAEFLRVDDELIEAAAAGSACEPPSEPSRTELARWVKGLPAADKDAYLLRFLAEEGDLLLRAEFSKRSREAAVPKGTRPAPGVERRTATQLLAARDALVEEKNRKAAERAARERARREREQADARAEYLDELARREPASWREIDELIATKRPKDYDRAVTLLVDLRDPAGGSGRTAEAEARILELRQRHSNKPSLLERFDDKKLGK